MTDENQTEEKEQPNGCASCDYSEEMSADGINKVLTCRRYPPQLFAFPVPGRVQGSMSISVNSQFPTVGPDAWCGEWAPQTVEEQ